MSKRRWHKAVNVAVALALGWVFLLPQSQVQAGTPDDSYTIERYYTENITQQTTTNTTFQDALTITFTPPNTANYTIIASALTNNSSTANSTVTRLVVNSDNYSETSHQPIDTSNNWRSFGTHKVSSLTGGISNTVKIQYRTKDGANTAYIKKAYLTVLEVANYYNAEANSENTTTSSTYVDALTLTFTPPSQADYLILSTANLGNNTSARQSFLEFTIDGAPDFELIQEGTTFIAWGNMEKENLLAASYTFKIRFKSQGSSVASIKDARITAILLSDLGSDNYAESELESRTSVNTTYVDKTILAFTPSTRGDYLVIASFLGYQENYPFIFYGNLDIDGSSYGEYVFVPPSAVEVYRSYIGAPKVNLSANTTHNIKIQYKTSDDQATAEAAIKNANAIAIKIDTAESYNDSAHATVNNNFDTAGEDTAYIWAHGLRPSSDNPTYAVGYYDASDNTTGGLKVFTHSGLTPTAYGNLSSQYYFPTADNATAGTWHAVVFDEEFGSPPTNYNDAATAAGYVVEDSFTVTAAAIPEFPTVIAAIGVAALCFGIYYWMRKRRLAHVTVKT